MVQNSTFRFSNWYSYLLPISGMTLFGVVAYCPSIIQYGYFGPVGDFLHYLAYNHQSLLRLGFVTACLVHFGEASYGLMLCRRANVSTKDQLLWFIQTLLLGFPSLVPMKKILKEKSS